MYLLISMPQLAGQEFVTIAFDELPHILYPMLDYFTKVTEED